jgi:adenosylcobinamide amidohydrolase
VLNAQVPGSYARVDPVAHLRELAADAGLSGPGVGLLTAAQVTDVVQCADEAVHAAATVGLRVPTWAAAPGGVADPELAPIEIRPRTAGLPPPPPFELRPRTAPVLPAPPEVGPPPPPPFETQPRPGTINVVVVLPLPLIDAALVNAVVTATEAKTQAVLEAGYAGTGTASDAVCVACPRPRPGEAAEIFAGPRSPWGGRVARAVHAAVRAGADRWTDRGMANGDH